MPRAAAITVSDKGYSGEREDRSGPLLAELLGALGLGVVFTAVVPGDQGRRWLLYTTPSPPDKGESRMPPSA